MSTCDFHTDKREEKKKCTQVPFLCWLAQCLPLQSSPLSLLHGIKFNLSLSLFGGIGLRLLVGQGVDTPQPIWLERDSEETEERWGGGKSGRDVTQDG